MSRQVRRDLSYFTMDCDIFSAKSGLKPLIDRFKADGLGVFIHILCDVYGTDYYFKPDNYEDYLYSVANDLGISVQKVQLIIAFMADRTLLDAFSLSKNTVITSHGIQKRYAEAMKGRKRTIAEIKGEHWLLTEKEEAEIDTFYKSHLFANKSEKMSDKSEKMSDKSEIYTTTEQNRTEHNIIQVSKKESNIKESSSHENKRESYDEIMEHWEVSDVVRVALGEFLQHCFANGQVVTNNRFDDLIYRLYKYYTSDDEMCNALRNAINGGYYDIERRREKPCK